jgi:hypothetical protein
MREKIHPRTLYALRDEGSIERLSRGLYRLANAVPLGELNHHESIIRL